MCVAWLLVAACATEKAAQSPGATLGTAAPTTTTTDPYAIPTPIDAAYVNRVLAGLDAVNGDVLRLSLAAKTIPRDAVDRFKAVYATDALLNFRLDSLSRDLAGGFAGIKPQPGNTVTTVSQMLSVKPTCVFVKVTRDYSSVAFTPLAELGTQWMAIAPLEPVRDPAKYNGTRWAFVYEGFERGFVAPSADPCAAF